MLNLVSVFNYINEGLKLNDERFIIVDGEHVLDSKTGVKLHLYDGWFKITHNDKLIAEMDNLSNDEHNSLWNIKRTVVGDDVMKQREDNFHTITKERRELLSSLFENPEPIVNKTPMVEPDAEDYQG